MAHMLKEKLIELLKKKKREGAEISDVEKEAKMSAVKDLSGMASEMMGGKLKGLKKITVASDSAEGLKEGLEKAEEIVEAKSEPEEEMEEESSDEMSSEEIDAEIARLIEKKKALENKEA